MLGRMRKKLRHILRTFRWNETLREDNVRSFLELMQDRIVFLVIAVDVLLVSQFYFLGETLNPLGAWVPVVMVLTLALAMVQLLLGRREFAALLLAYMHMTLLIVSQVLRYVLPPSPSVTPFASVLVIIVNAILFMTFAGIFVNRVHTVVIGFACILYVSFFAYFTGDFMLNRMFVYLVVTLLFFVFTVFYLMRLLRYILFRLLDIKDNLDRKVRERTSELAESKKRVEEEKRARDAFFANISHDLRGPLNSILGYSDVLLQETTDETHRHHLRTIQSAGRNLLSLLDSLLNVANIESDELELELDDLRIREVVEDVHDLLSVRVAERDVRFGTEVKPDVPEVLWTDPVRIQQILHNLIENAIKYTEEGSVELSVCREDGDDTGNEEVDLLVVVRDTGRGMTPEERETLFEVDPEERPEDVPEGFGFGLHLTRKLVRRMDGSIEVESEPGEGSLFRVRFPGVPVRESDFEEEDSEGNRTKNEVTLPGSLTDNEVSDLRRYLAEYDRTGSLAVVRELVERLDELAEGHDDPALWTLAQSLEEALDRYDVVSIENYLTALEEEC